MSHTKEYYREYRKRNIGWFLLKEKRFRENHREELNARRKTYISKLRKEGGERWEKHCETARKCEIRKKLKQRIAALIHYGGNPPHCSCCGENKYEFLCIDHINGGGGKHRKEYPKAIHINRWLKNNNYPDGFRVLCHNCNMALGIYGYCPHNHAGIVIEPAHLGL